MRRLFLILALLIAAPCWGQMVHRQSSNGGGNASSTTCVLPVSENSGDYIFLSAEWSTGNTTPTVSDNLGTPTTYNQVELELTHTIRTALYVGTAAVTGIPTITFSETSAGNVQLQCQEYVPNGISTSFETPVITTFSSQASPAVSGNLVTSKNGEFVYFFGQKTSNSTGIAPDNTFMPVSIRASNNIGTAGIKNAGLAGTYTGSLISGGTITGTSVIVGFLPSSIQINTTALPDAIQGDSYSFTLAAQGGTGAYTWSITSGLLPLGLSLNSSTGIISGTPTHSNANSITIQVGDGTVTASSSFTLHVGTAAATISHVKDASAGVFSGGVTAGDVIVIGAATNTGGVAPFCSDSINTPYKIDSFSGGLIPNGGHFEYILSGIAPSTSANTVTCVGTSINRVAASEFSNVQDIADNWAQTKGNSGTSLTSNSLTPLASNGLLYAGMVCETCSSGSSITAPFTLTGSLGTNFIFGWNTSTTITGYTVNFSVTTNTGDWDILLSSYRPTTTGTAPLPPAGYPVIY